MTIGRSDLPAETAALLACAQYVLSPSGADRVRHALAACASVERLCNTAVRHGMLGHLHQVMRNVDDGTVDHAARSEVARLYRLSAERNLRQTARLLSLLQQLEGSGIEAMPIKGPLWAERLYGDVTLRQWVDLDLVVPLAQVPEARARLLDAGYRDGQTYHERLLRRRRPTEGELPFWPPEGGISVDVHWQVGVGHSPCALDATGLFARAVPQTVLGRPVLGPSVDDRLLLTCLHGTRHRWNRVEQLLSVAVQARDVPAHHWPAALTVARDAGCKRRVLVAVAHSCRVLGLPRPVEVDRALAQDRAAAVLLRSLEPETLLPDRDDGRHRRLDEIAWTVASEDSLLAGLEHVTLRVFRPGPGDWQSLSLPPNADWIYWVLRPPRLARKWLSRAEWERSS